MTGVDAVTLEIRSTTVFRGLNIWARMPAILLEVGVGELEAQGYPQEGRKSSPSAA